MEDQNIAEAAVAEEAEVVSADVTEESEVHLPDMDEEQLEQVQKAVAEKIRQNREKSREADLNTIKALIAKHGFKASEVRVPRDTKNTKVAPKYRNPENPEQTWTGRGKAPAWIADYAKEDRAQFLIES